MAWARPGYSPPDFVGVSLHFCVVDLTLRIRILLGNPSRPKLLLVIPVECEQSFATLRHLKRV